MDRQRSSTEGNGPHYPLVGEATWRDIVHECRLGSTVGESRTAVADRGQNHCVVLNEHDILMGRLRTLSELTVARL
jgi:hypothetical protein